MAVFKFFFNLCTWALRVDAPAGSDPLRHEAIARMNARQLADLPLGEVTFQPEPLQAARINPPLCRCA